MKIVIIQDNFINYHKEIENKEKKKFNFEKLWIKIM
jgi:hypothetical protein